MVVVRVRAAGRGGRLAHVGIDDGELLQPLKTGEAVVQIARVPHAAFLPSFFLCL